MIKIFILTLFFLTSCNISNPSSGQKIGQIVKLAKEGMISKTWEGDLIRGGMVDGSGTIGGTFHFTIEDEELAKTAQKCLENKTEVVIYYQVEFISSIFRSESGKPHFVKKIEIYKNE